MQTSHIEASAPEAPPPQVVYDAPPKYEHLVEDYDNEATFPNASAPQVEIPPVRQESVNAYDEPVDLTEDAGLASINPQNFSKVTCGYVLLWLLRIIRV